MRARGTFVRDHAPRGRKGVELDGRDTEFLGGKLAVERSQAEMPCFRAITLRLARHGAFERHGALAPGDRGGGEGDVARGRVEAEFEIGIVDRNRCVRERRENDAAGAGVDAQICVLENLPADKSSVRSPATGMSSTSSNERCGEASASVLGMRSRTVAVTLRASGAGSSVRKETIHLPREELMDAAPEMERPSRPMAPSATLSSLPLPS